MELPIYNQAGERTGTVNLPDSVFGLKWNADLVYQVVTGQEANRRTKVARAKTRAEVSGGGKKPWRQKGTGRARHGSTRSPIWKGGGVAHGPIKETVYGKKINRKMAKKALYTVLSAKLKDGEVVVVDNFDFKDNKTKLASEMFSKMARNHEKITKGNGALVALNSEAKPAKRSLRNLPYVNLIDARNLTAFDVMQYRYVVFPKDALEAFNKSR